VIAFLNTNRLTPDLVELVSCELLLVAGASLAERQRVYRVLRFLLDVGVVVAVAPVGIRVLVSGRLEHGSVSEVRHWNPGFRSAALFHIVKLFLGRLEVHTVWVQQSGFFLQIERLLGRELDFGSEILLVGGVRLVGVRVSDETVVAASTPAVVLVAGLELFDYCARLQ
jgi:hypothetical protein